MSNHNPYLKAIDWLILIVNLAAMAANAVLLKPTFDRLVRSTDLASWLVTVSALTGGVALAWMAGHHAQRDQHLAARVSAGLYAGLASRWPGQTRPPADREGLGGHRGPHGRHTPGHPPCLRGMGHRAQHLRIGRRSGANRPSRTPRDRYPGPARLPGSPPGPATHRGDPTEPHLR